MVDAAVELDRQAYGSFGGGGTIELVVLLRNESNLELAGQRRVVFAAADLLMQVLLFARRLGLEQRALTVKRQVAAACGRSVCVQVLEGSLERHARRRRRRRRRARCVLLSCRTVVALLLLLLQLLLLLTVLVLGVRRFERQRRRRRQRARRGWRCREAAASTSAS